VTGEVDYPTEVKTRELGINLILAGHGETETFGVQALAEKLKAVGRNKRIDANGRLVPGGSQLVSKKHRSVNFGASW